MVELLKYFGRMTMLLAAFLPLVAGVRASMFESERVPDLRWPAGIIRIALSDSLLSESSAINRGSDVRGALERSLRTWEAAGEIKFETTESSRQSVSPSGQSGDGISLITIAGTAENVLFFGKDSADAPAATRIFRDRTGAITEADIVLNPTQQFSTDGSFGSYDLESVLLHEIGHLLGLDHIEIPSSTMYTGLARNGLFGTPLTYMRTLAAADISAIRSRYAVDGSRGDCCGSVSGRIVSATGRAAKGSAVFAEDAENGRLLGFAQADENGNYRLNGLYEGDAKLIFVGPSVSGTRRIFPGTETASIAVGEEQKVNGRSKSGSEKGTEILVGLNGQLTNSALTIVPGKRTRVYIGSRSAFDADGELLATSNSISIDPASRTVHTDYEGLNVVSFDLVADEDLSAGEYSLVIALSDGTQRLLPGVLGIE